ncbi:MAG: exodeoxyribonuclease VII small subunit [Phycisphaerales bacterium]
MSKAPGKNSGKVGAPNAEVAKLEFEQALAEVESIIDRIESGEIGLEESLKEYERGVVLVAHCRARLDRAQQQVDDLTRRLEEADDKPSAGEDAPADDDEDTRPPAPF